MQEPRVASRYAKPLLELAQEKGDLEKVKDDMELFISMCDTNTQLKRILSNPVIPHEKKKNILDALLKSKVSKLTMMMFDIITRKNRENYLYFIAKNFLRQYKVVKGIQTAKVITTYPLTSIQKDIFIQQVKDISGKDKVDLVEKTEESLIGGYILRVGDKQIDESVKSKLKDLEHKFYDSSYIVKL